jgi:ribosomal protein S12 methylthiotransferase accessory factor
MLLDTGAGVTAGAYTLTDLVDARVGIVRSCGRVAQDWREPPWPIVYRATLANFDFRRVPELERLTSGKGVTERDSERSAIVEALERYCAQQRRPGAFTTRRASDLDHPAILPEELVLYSDAQYRAPGFPYRRPTPDAEVTWVQATRADFAAAVYAPASLVYMNFAGAGGRELFTRTNTSGLAGGPDLPSAVLAAIYELVERDAYMITWLTRLPAARITFDESDGLAAQISRHYARFAIETLAFDVTTDLRIPVVMAVAVDHSGALPAAVVGLGCDLDPVSALDRAVMEIVQVRTGLVPHFRQHPPPSPLERYEDVRSLEDHAAFAANPANLHELAFLLTGDSRVHLADLADDSRGSVEDDLALCVERLDAAGAKVAFVDLTMPDLEAFPVRIVRALASGLQPIHFGFGQERLGGRRPFDVPRLLAKADRALTEADLNPCPHPLA